MPTAFRSASTNTDPSDRYNRQKNKDTLRIINKVKMFYMKKYSILLTACMLLAGIAGAQTANYKVVFDITSKDTVNQQSLVRELGLIRQSNPNAQMEVVVYGQG